MQEAHRSRNPGGDSCTFDALRERCASFLSASYGLRALRALLGILEVHFDLPCSLLIKSGAMPNFM